MSRLAKRIDEVVDLTNEMAFPDAQARVGAFRLLARAVGEMPTQEKKRVMPLIWTHGDVWQPDFSTWHSQVFSEVTGRTLFVDTRKGDVVFDEDVAFRTEEEACRMALAWDMWIVVQLGHNAEELRRLLSSPATGVFLRRLMAEDEVDALPDIVDAKSHILAQVDDESVATSSTAKLRETLQGTLDKFNLSRVAEASTKAVLDALDAKSKIRG